MIQLIPPVPARAANACPVAKDRVAATLRDTNVSGTVNTAGTDGGLTTYSKLTQPFHGSVTVTSNGGWTYTPASSYVGIDCFVVRAEGSSGESINYTIYIMVAPTAADARSSLTARHPRIMASDEDFDNLKVLVDTDPTLQNWYTAVKTAADGYLAAPVIAYQLTGGQLLSVSREAVKRMKTLGLVYRITGDGRYAARAWEDLQAICGFPDWNPLQFLDTGEMAAAVAIGYDWIYDYLDTAQRSAIRQGIVNHAFIPANAAYTGQLWNGKDISSFAKRQDNWSLVCNGGIGMAAIAVGDEESMYAGSMISYSLKAMINPLVNLSPDGGWPEGPVYWNYGMKYFTLYLASLDKSMNTDYGLSSFPGVSQTVHYGISTMGGTTRVNIGDDQLSEQVDNAFALWHGKKFGKPEYAWFRKYALTQLWANGPEALDILFYQPDLYQADKKPSQTDWYHRKTEITTFTNGVGDPNAVYAMLAGGDNRKNHGDLDAGNFVFDALGERWAMELGRENYSVAGYFDNGENGQRWTYYRKRAEGQNTLVINPENTPDQNPLALSKIVDCQSDEQRGYSIVDMTPAYDRNADSLKRGMGLVNHRTQLLVQDEITLKQPGSVWWFLHTQADITIIDASTVRFDLNGKHMQARILSPAGAAFQVMPAAPLPTSPQTTGANQNTDIRKLAVHLTDFTAGTIAVWLAPYNAADPVPAGTPSVLPLNTWHALLDRNFYTTAFQDLTDTNTGQPYGKLKIGTQNITVTFYHSAAEDHGIFIGALMRKSDHTLTGLFMNRVEMKQGSNQTELSLDIPENADDYSLKLMLWSGLEDRKPCSVPLYIDSSGIHWN